LTALASHHDGLLDRAVATIGWRLPVAWPPARLRGALAALDLPPGVGLDFHAAEAAVCGHRDGRLARAFRTAIRAAGAAPGHKLKTGTSDWNVVAPAWDCDAVAYGPGDAALDHAPDERIDLRELDRAVAVLGRVLASVGGVPGAGDASSGG
jgi:[amino group carrier protein]-lysine/ornithine hydrolase